ncbi:MAG: 16S rRNA (guanine(527)-N(7))-methyltransferase RsmG [Campylobacterota bacterium]|nr:16S rRNA (guanine(527)-N(7))-methyltransferase RsmG [Campylobacterota bacterium]
MHNLKTQLDNAGLLFTDDLFERLKRYSEHLFKWNRIHNLTGVKNKAELNEFIYDALYPISFLPALKQAMDIGTGAGFPGLILAMALPETHFTLVEPLKKRASFLQFIKADLGLDNVSVKSCRVEELEPEPMELITSRAVTDTKLLLKLSQPFMVQGTLLLFYKGEKVFEEVDPSLKHQIIQTDKRHYLLIENAS